MKLREAIREKYNCYRIYNYFKVGQLGTNGFTRNFVYHTGKNTLQKIETAAPALLEDFTYDTCGNQLTAGTTRNYVWNAANQLITYKNQSGSNDPTIFAQYDYSGMNRVSKMVKTGSAGSPVYERTIYIDGVFEYHILENGTTYEKNYVHVMDDTSRIAMVRVGDQFPDDIADSVTYNLEDQIGSSSMRLNTSGAVIDKEEYYPFGDSSLRTFTKKRYRYVGKEKDLESGLYYYGARYYAAWTCRFISVDPLASDYPFYTPYNYAGNKPMNKIDIDGMQEGENLTEPNGDNSSNQDTGEYHGQARMDEYGCVEAWDSTISDDQTSGVWIQIDPSNDKEVKQFLQKHYESYIYENERFWYNNPELRDTLNREGERLNIDPLWIYTVMVQEGMLYHDFNSSNEIDGYGLAGLDQIAGSYDKYVDAGYLPADFKEKYVASTESGSNEKDEDTSYFNYKNVEGVVIATAAVIAARNQQMLNVASENGMGSPNSNQFHYWSYWFFNRPGGTSSNSWGGTIRLPMTGEWYIHEDIPYRNKEQASPPHVDYGLRTLSYQRLVTYRFYQIRSFDFSRYKY